jgi:hypothetical protein
MTSDDRATDYQPEGRVYDPDIGVWVWPRDPAPIGNPPERPADRRTGDRRSPQTVAAPTPAPTYAPKG